MFPCRDAQSVLLLTVSITSSLFWMCQSSVFFALLTLEVCSTQQMERDPLYPIVNFALFYVDRMRYPRVKYRAENFLQGFDKRVKELLAYVDGLLKVGKVALRHARHI